MKGIVNDGGKCSIGHIYFYSNEKVYRFTEEEWQSRIPYVANLLPDANDGGSFAE